MKEREKFTFLIDHLDPLAQGVDKTSDKITFIPKTLPGESGKAEITHQSKGVQFARLSELLNQASDRITPECTHYQHCSGCDYLHTPYEREIFYKESSFKKIFQKFSDSHIEIIKAPSRLGYRNRIQLHYNKRQKKLGFFQGRSKNISEVPNCLIIEPRIKKVLTDLYQNQSWLKLAPGKPNAGHLEVYLLNDQVKLTWNSHYSDGGFTQVNKEMNRVLQKLVADCARTYFCEKDTIFDLFSGDGNLVSDLKKDFKIHHFDAFAREIENFHHLDLFKEHQLEKYQALISNNCNFIIDPPRSGFKNLSVWIEAFKPRNFIYVSCNAATLNRDLISINELYHIKQLKLLDLFPSTKHFETFSLCVKK